jgi:D-alanyl-lipoteichoic acid acyltransferase DltB (MBOAT superfamily)
MPQLREPHTFEYRETTLGLRMMLLGFFKKVAVADMIAIYVDNVYDHLSDGFTGLALVLATVLFAFQIYCDFSGYSDIAVGVSKVFGIELTINFKSPYFSRNIQEFWRRWHISLSTWFQDYVYIPLGGSRVPVPRYVLNLLITFTISGLWHGASWSFVIWGALHGLLVAGFVLSKRISRGLREKRQAQGPSSPKTCEAGAGARATVALKTTLLVLVNFIVVDILWVFFRCENLSEVGYVFTHAFSGWDMSMAYVADQLVSMGFTKGTLLAVIILMMVLFVVDKINYQENVAVVLTRQRTFIRWGVYILGSFIVIAAFMFTAESQNFIYFQF